MIALLKSLAEAARLYLTIRTIRASWDLTNDIESRYHSDYEKLRNLRDSPHASDRDDAIRLLDSMAARAGIATRLKSALDSANTADSADSRRADSTKPDRNMAQPPESNGTARPTS